MWRDEFGQRALAPDGEPHPLGDGESTEAEMFGYQRR